VLQSTSIERYLTVSETIAMYATFYAHPRPVDEVIRLVGLEEKRDFRVLKLSGGQQRRLDVAIALVANPELLFLDEPTTGFDPSARHEAWEVIKNLATLGMTVILTTHYMDEAQRLADRVAIIDHGRMVVTGSPADLTGTTGQLRFRAEPGLDTDGLLAALPPGTAAKESPAGHYIVEVHDRVDPQLLAAVTAWCAERGVLAQDLRIESRSLEDVFLELTGRELRS
jgi:ABC-2 type transport system ATP-binding protein